MTQTDTAIGINLIGWEEQGHIRRNDVRLRNENDLGGSCTRIVRTCVGRVSEVQRRAIPSAKKPFPIGPGNDVRKQKKSNSVGQVPERKSNLVITF